MATTWNSEINADVVTLPCAMVVVWRLDKYPTAHNLIVEGLQLFCSVTNVGFDGLGRQHVFKCDLYWNVNGRTPCFTVSFPRCRFFNRADWMPKTFARNCANQFVFINSLSESEKIIAVKNAKLKILQ